MNTSQLFQTRKPRISKTHKNYMEERDIPIKP